MSSAVVRSGSYSAPSVPSAPHDTGAGDRPSHIRRRSRLSIFTQSTDRRAPPWRLALVQGPCVTVRGHYITEKPGARRLRPPGHDRPQPAGKAMELVGEGGEPAAWSAACRPRYLAPIVTGPPGPLRCLQRWESRDHPTDAKRHIIRRDRAVLGRYS